MPTRTSHVRIPSWGAQESRSPFDHELQLLHPNSVNFSTGANTSCTSGRPRRTHPARCTHLSTAKMHVPDACMSGRAHFAPSTHCDASVLPARVNGDSARLLLPG